MFTHCLLRWVDTLILLKWKLEVKHSGGIIKQLVAKQPSIYMKQFDVGRKAIQGSHNQKQ